MRYKTGSALVGAYQERPTPRTAVYPSIAAEMNVSTPSQDLSTCIEITTYPLALRASFMGTRKLQGSEASPDAGSPVASEHRQPYGNLHQTNNSL